MVYGNNVRIESQLNLFNKMLNIDGGKGQRSVVNYIGQSMAYDKHSSKRFNVITKQIEPVLLYFDISPVDKVRTK